MKLLTCLLTLLLMGQNLFGNDASWRHVPTKWDIADCAVDGTTLWVASYSGLVRFNLITKEKQYFNSINSPLLKNNITSIEIDKDKNLWLGLYGGGVAKMKDGNWEFFNTSNSSLPDDFVMDITQDKNGLVWFATFNGLVSYSGKNMKIYTSANSELPDNRVMRLAADSAGGIWIGSFENQQKGSVSHLNGNSWEVFKDYDKGFMGSDVTAISVDKNGKVWVGNKRNSLQWYTGTEWKITSMKAGLDNIQFYTEMPIASISHDNNGKIYASTSQGLGIFDGINWSYYAPKGKDSSGLSIPVNVITPYQDKIILAGIADIIIWNGSTIWETQTIRETPFNTNTTIHNLTRGQDENVFLTIGGSIYQTNSKSNEWKVFPNPPTPNNYINGFNQFVCTDKGTILTSVLFDIMQYKNGIWSKFPIDAYITSIAIVSEDIAWFGLHYSKGIAKLENGALVRYNSANSGITLEYVNAVAVDKQNTLWVGMNEGLARFNGQSWEMVNDCPIKNIQSIKFDNNEKMWLASTLGLAVFEKGNWTVYNTANSPLPVNKISALDIDTKNTLWIGTEKGLVKFDGSWSIFNSSNSPISDERIQKLVVDKKNQIWMSTLYDGMFIYNPGEPNSVAENYISKEISLVYPNPAKDYLNLQTSLPTGDISIRVHSLLGETVAEQFQHNNNEAFSLRLPIENLASGVYFVTLKSEGKSVTRMFVKE